MLYLHLYCCKCYDLILCVIYNGILLDHKRNVYISHIFFIYSSINGHLGCFHILVILIQKDTYTPMFIAALGACIFLNECFCFLQTDTQEWNCWLVWTVQFSHSVVSDSLQPHGLQHARLTCPSPTPGACSN